MIALIEVPHQLPAKINWYSDADTLEEASLNEAMAAGATVAEEPNDFDSAVRYLAHDWHTYELVQSADDIQAVRDYRGHQEHKVRAMVKELEEEFTE